MADYPVLTVLPVGMGSCNLIEVYEDKAHTKLKYLAMVDYGGNEDLAETQSYILEKITLRHNYNKDPNNVYLDLFLLTHQDDDHWSLFEKFIQKNFANKVFGKTNIKYGSMFKTCCNKRRTYHSAIYKLNSNYYHYKEAVISKSDYNYIITYYTNNKSEELHIKDRFCIYKVKILDPTSKEIISIRLTTKTFPVPVPAYPTYSYKYIEVNKITGIEEVKEKTIRQNEIIDIINKNFKEITSLEDLFNEITNEFKASNNSIPIIDKFYYGGDNYSAKTKHFKKLMKNISISHKKLTDGEIISNFADTYCAQVLCRINTSSNTELKENLPKGATKAPTGQSIQRNASSAVTLWTFKDDAKYLITGDATVHTMYSVYSNPDKKDDCQKAITTSPHHGSDSTSMGQIKVSDYDVLDSFLYKISPKAIIISAAYANKYGLPRENFVSLCKKNLNEVILKHYICFCRDDNKNWRIWKPNCELYSTFQNDEPKHNTNSLFYPLHYYHHQFIGTTHTEKMYGNVRKDDKDVVVNDYWTPGKIDTITDLICATKRKWKDCGDSPEDYQVKKRGTTSTSTFSLKRR